MSRPRIVWQSGRQGGKSAEVLAELKRRGGGSLVVLPEQAEVWASKLKREGATVTCVLGVDFPVGTPEGRERPRDE